MLLNKEGEVEIGPQLKEFKEFTDAFPSEVGGVGGGGGGHADSSSHTVMERR